MFYVIAAIMLGHERPMPILVDVPTFPTFEAALAQLREYLAEGELPPPDANLFFVVVPREEPLPNVDLVPVLKAQDDPILDSTISITAVGMHATTVEEKHELCIMDSSRGLCVGCDDCADRFIPEMPCLSDEGACFIAQSCNGCDRA